MRAGLHGFPQKKKKKTKKTKQKKPSKFQIFLNQLQPTCYNNERLQYEL